MERIKRIVSKYRLKRVSLFSFDLNLKALLLFGFIFILFFVGFQLFVLQAKEAKAQNQPQAKLFPSPSTGSFLVGSTFDVSIIVDTDGVPINTVKVDLKFPADKLQIVSPSSGKSFISIWLKQPAYSNTKGTISFAGGVPEGINTSSGIISTITFRAIKTGEAIVRILPSSSVLAHDGKGTEILDKLIDGRYILRPKPPEGPKVFSKTHPDESRWYNNNNPIISWEKEPGVTDFSFVLDSYPQTVPNNTSDGQETTKAYENLADGLWYFHIKAQEEGIWGAPSHFLLRIDTTPPAPFKLKMEFLAAAVIGRAFVSFSTTDALSGIDHYEVAIIDRTEPPLEAPVFIEAESPYQL
ncbi:MAG: cohesin domain-containing protein, partial [Candidatus Aminicenantia bacterium]